MSDLFEAIFGSKPEHACFAPGRVNLIGEYTDLVGGSVLPMPLRKGITVEVGRAVADTRVHSGLRGETVILDLGSDAKDHWADYVAGPLVQLQSAGIELPPLNLSVEADLPPGAGVSSSAALEVAVIRAALALVDRPTSDQDIARLAQRAENEFCGVQCGIMDQMAVAAGTLGAALSLDCGTLEARNIPVPTGWLFAVIHCGVERQLSDGAYNERRAAVEAAAAELGRDLKGQSIEAVETLRDPTLRGRARHIVSEQARVAAAVRAMEAGDRVLFGQLMNESHVSLARDFEVSTQELDILVTAARDAGAYGARLTGAGFGGCIVALLDADRADDWWSAVSAQVPEAWVVQI